MNLRDHSQQMLTLLRREFWEHRFATLWVPTIVAGICLLVWFRFSLTNTEDILAFFTNLALLEQEEYRVQLNLAFGSLTLLFTIGLLIIVPIYLMLSLYQDRKDGSYLFWYSMPVSNTKTVLSKLLTATLLMPGVALLIFLALCLLVLVLLSLSLLFHQESLAVSGLILGGLLRWTAYLLMLIIYIAFWYLPLYGWLLLISAFSRAVPVFWAIGLLIAINLGERLLLSSSYFGTWLGSRQMPYNELFGDMSDLLPTVPWYEMAYGVVMGSLLITGAILMRRFPD